MLPKTASGAQKHRKLKRVREITLAMSAISEVYGKPVENGTSGLNVLEIGSGNGFQIPYLSQFGRVTASDIFISDEIKAMDDVDFVQCSMTDLPFSDGYFDLVFSNHVVEHVYDIEAGFRELKRIGKPGCIYAHAVPTSTWLLVSLPAQYYDKLRVGFSRLLARRQTSMRNGHASVGQQRAANGVDSKPKRSNLGRFILPAGHGIYPEFPECYRQFKPGRWENLFTDGGFELLRVEPLLLYGPSEWPVVPTTRIFRGANMCSSILFIMRNLEN